MRNCRPGFTLKLKPKRTEFHPLRPGRPTVLHAGNRGGTERMNMSECPEHDKLDKIHDKSQAIGEFL